MDPDITNAQLPFRERSLHRVLIEVLLHLPPAMLMAARVDERNVRGSGPDFGCEVGIRHVNCCGVLCDESFDLFSRYTGPSGAHGGARLFSVSSPAAASFGFAKLSADYSTGSLTVLLR